jgi:hypothetical protein
MPNFHSEVKAMGRTKKRDKCENDILKHLCAIRDIYRKYNPAGTYLSICISGNHCDTVSANNEYWDADREKPIDFYVIGDGEKMSINR